MPATGVCSMSNKAAAHRACQTGPALRASASIAKSVSLPLVVPNFRHKRHEQTCETASPGRLSLSLYRAWGRLSLSLSALFVAGFRAFLFGKDRRLNKNLSRTKSTTTLPLPLHRRKHSRQLSITLACQRFLLPPRMFNCCGRRGAAFGAAFL